MCGLPMKASASARRRHATLSQHTISLLAACEIVGADAVHPGYGFLSENARFADILDAHGITFIGPTAEHIRIMGDKIEAKKTIAALGVPVVPGSDGAVDTPTRRKKLPLRSAFRSWSRRRPAAVAAA
jgi:acetyl-CoA carboxylase biotin carboxylase subunit